jgi:hypothetical protein
VVFHQVDQATGATGASDVAAHAVADRAHGCRVYNDNVRLDVGCTLYCDRDLVFYAHGVPIFLQTN